MGTLADCAGPRRSLGMFVAIYFSASLDSSPPLGIAGESCALSLGYSWSCVDWALLSKFTRRFTSALRVCQSFLLFHILSAKWGVAVRSAVGPLQLDLPHFQMLYLPLLSWSRCDSQLYRCLHPPHHSLTFVVIDNMKLRGDVSNPKVPYQPDYTSVFLLFA